MLFSESLEMKRYKESHGRSYSYTINNDQHHFSSRSIHQPSLYIPSFQVFRQSHPEANMLYITAILALAAAVMASPTGTPPPSETPSCPGTGTGGGTPTPANVCPSGLYSNPQCCATDVLGAVGLNCAVRKYLSFQTTVSPLLT